MTEEQIANAENEGMPHLPGMPEVPFTVEQTDPGENHKELMEMLGGIFIQQSRIYDVLMAMLPQALEEELDELHTAGRLMFSPPTLLEKAWEGSEEPKQ